MRERVQAARPGAMKRAARLLTRKNDTTPPRISGADFLDNGERGFGGTHDTVELIAHFVFGKNVSD